jgi:membrane-associated phospholipid phosphatase
MTSRRLLLAGIVLILLGLLLWAAAPLDHAIHIDALLDRQGVGRQVALSLSFLGGLTGMGPIALAVVAALLIRRRSAMALWLFCTIASGRLVVEGIKLVIQRPRPPVADRLEAVTSWSFPSSHSAGTMMTCAALALLWGRPVGWFAALPIAGAVGWSRIALGVHWPSDVMAGWGFGLLWVGMAARWRPKSKLRSP